MELSQFNFLRHARRFVVLAFVCLFLIVLTARGSEAGTVSINVLQRTFNIAAVYPDGKTASGTAFTIEVEGRQYLVSAKHIFSVGANAPGLKIFHNGAWLELPYKRIEVQPESVDIAVLALEKQISPLHPITLTTKGMILSEEVFFLGFPLQLQIDARLINNGFPIPLVKHGIISFFNANSNAYSKGEPRLIDAMNVPGFSGGPVVQMKDNKNPVIYGVISGYRSHAREILQSGKGCTELRNAGKLCDDLAFSENTGLTVFYDINYALEAIKKNPIGFELATESKR